MSIHSDWWHRWQSSICKAGTLPMACDDLEERGGNVEPYRLFMADEASTDDQTIVRMWDSMTLAQAEYERINQTQRPRQYVLGQQRSTDQTVLDRLVGSFYTRASLPLGTMVRNIAVLDGMLMHDVTLRQYVWNSTTQGVLSNHRFEATRRLTLAPLNSHIEDYGISHIPGQSLISLHITGILSQKSVTKARIDFLTSKTIRKGCVFTMVSGGREIYRRVK